MRSNTTSKNSIFDINHTVTKPLSKMTPKEQSSLEKGDYISPPPSTNTLATTTFPSTNSITVPLNTTREYTRNNVYSNIPYVETRSKRYWVDIGEEFLKGPERPKSTTVQIQPPTKEPSEKDIVITNPATSDNNINLSFLPTRSNFLGQGQFSTVYKGYYSISNEKLKRCAIKRMNSDQESQMMGLSELYILKSLCSQHIIKLIGSKDESQLVKYEISNENKNKLMQSLTSPRLLLILEYYPNGDLWNFITTRKFIMNRRWWLVWGIGLCKALKYLNENRIVHHDVKPHNVMLDENLNAILSDFGNACFHSPNDTHDGSGRGTQPFTAPELLSNAPYTYKIDTYALGVSLYSLITLKPPFYKATSSVHLIVGIKKGFFESGLQDHDGGEGDLEFRRLIEKEEGNFLGSGNWEMVRRMVGKDVDGRPGWDEVLRVFEGDLERLGKNIA